MFLPGESQGQGSLVGFHLWGHTELDTTEEAVVTKIHALSCSVCHLLCPVHLHHLAYGAVGKASAYNVGAEKAMASHSSTLAWKIPWMEETGGLQSMGSLKVAHD